MSEQKLVHVGYLKKMGENNIADSWGSWEEEEEEEEDNAKDD